MTTPLPAFVSNPLRVQLGVVKAAALLMGLSLCMGVRAAPPATGARPDQAPSYSDYCGGGVMRGGARMEELHKQLALTDAQETLWKKARDTSDKLHQDMRQSMQARHDKLRQSLEGKSPDLRALADQMDKDRDADQQRHKQVQEAWLNFYDALNPEQKQKASRFLLGMINRMGDGHGRPMGGHMGRGMPPAGEHMDAPMRR
ncbi:MAG TPA: Spy/CpxP family protein refolding chaperone [Rhodocyclaceae bacterium]|nr:Spy/CpxP family protein refolding chaperone [Rhodocyclaceae bacterium]